MPGRRSTAAPSTRGSSGRLVLSSFAAQERAADSAAAAAARRAGTYDASSHDDGDQSARRSHRSTRVEHAHAEQQALAGFASASVAASNPTGRLPMAGAHAGRPEHAADDVPAGGADAPCESRTPGGGSPRPGVTRLNSPSIDSANASRGKQREHPRAESPRRHLLVHHVLEHADAADERARIALTRLRLDRRRHRQRAVLPRPASAARRGS